jgi:hypothetical protein
MGDKSARDFTANARGAGRYKRSLIDVTRFFPRSFSTPLTITGAPASRGTHFHPS